MIFGNEVERIIRLSAEAQGRSLGYYWPADESGRNDPCEANLSLHFAHVLLTEGFAVFAEPNHPQIPERSGCLILGIDLLAISGDRTWLLACEFKKHFSSTMEPSRSDLDRLFHFRLNTRLHEERFGEEQLRVTKLCTYGVGLVAGLNWQRDGEGALRNTEGQREFNAKVMQWGGRVAKPLLVRRSVRPDATGGYFLQHAYFPLPLLG